MRWEYGVLRRGSVHSTTAGSYHFSAPIQPMEFPADTPLEDVLNALGRIEWELVTAEYPPTTTFRWIFKRPDVPTQE